MTHSGNSRITVAVGLSGGIDSAVTARILQEQGYDLIGITMLTWDGSLQIPDSMRSGCFGPGEERDVESAQSVARRLGIPHRTVKLSEEFRTSVLDYFRSEYLHGRTPNPCVMCNRKIKFGMLLEKARSAGITFDFFATGHYARIEKDTKSGRYLLKRGTDRTKDQSYFLSYLAQDQLSKLILPLGGLDKTEIRKKAAEAGWKDLTERKESQDFIECDDYSVLFNPKDIRPGPMVDLSGRVLGEHRGIVHYTIGQRKGLGLKGFKEPLYVVRIDSCANSVIVGPRESLFSSRLSAGKVNWISFENPPTGPIRVKAKIRQQHHEAPAILTAATDHAALEFDEPQMSITPGQTVVFYDGDTVIGAGVIS